MTRRARCSGGVLVWAHVCTRVSKGGALRLLLRVPLLSYRVSPHVLPGTQAERRPELYVDGGDIEVNQIWKLAEREVTERGLRLRRRGWQATVSVRKQQRIGRQRASLVGGQLKHWVRVGLQCFYQASLWDQRRDPARWLTEDCQGVSWLLTHTASRPVPLTAFILGLHLVP